MIGSLFQLDLHVEAVFSGEQACRTIEQSTYTLADPTKEVYIYKCGSIDAIFDV